MYMIGLLSIPNNLCTIVNDLNILHDKIHPNLNTENIMLLKESAILIPKNNSSMH